MRELAHRFMALYVDAADRHKVLLNELENLPKGKRAEIVSVQRGLIDTVRRLLVEIEPALRRFESPVRILWGTGDTLFSASSPDWLDQTFPNSRGVRRVQGAKLFWPEEFPDLLAEEARKLWGVTA